MTPLYWLHDCMYSSIWAQILLSTWSCWNLFFEQFSWYRERSRSPRHSTWESLRLWCSLPPWRQKFLLLQWNTAFCNALGESLSHQMPISCYHLFLVISSACFTFLPRLDSCSFRKWESMVPGCCLKAGSLLSKKFGELEFSILMCCRIPTSNW